VLLFTIGELDADGFGLLVRDTVFEREPMDNTGSIGDSEGDIVLIGDIIGDTLGDIIGDTVGDIIGDTVGDIIGDTVGDIIGDTLGDIIGDILVDTVIIGDIEAEILFIALPAWLNILSIP